MSQALRKLTGSVARSKCVLMFTNQIRMKIGVMFGSPETTTGGNALKFYASQRLDIRRIGAIKEASKDKKGDMVVVGNRTRVKVVKNKMAPPFREAEFDIYYGKGVSRSGEVVDMGSDLNLIQKSGAWYSVGSERIGQGRDNARAYLEEHPELMAKLELQILVHNGVGPNGLGPNGVTPVVPLSPRMAQLALKPSKAATKKQKGAGETLRTALPWLRTRPPAREPRASRQMTTMPTMRMPAPKLVAPSRTATAALRQLRLRLLLQLPPSALSARTELPASRC